MDMVQGGLGIKPEKQASLEELKHEYFSENVEYAKVSQAVLEGRRDTVVAETRGLLSKGKDPVDLVSNALMPGIQVQCEMYDLGKAFVPEILMSNAAMLGGIGLCQDKLGDIPKNGRIISFVAEGDLHDIGKNIVAAILRANGYDVIDLGRDVPAKKVVDTAKEEGVQLVCGSTLMSTTKPGLMAVADQLENECNGISIACGGAAVSKHFVETFGNSIYTKSPLETVHTADAICKGKKWKEFR